MNITKRLISFTTAVVTAATFVVSATGCSMREFFTGESEKNQITASADPAADGKLTNEEWLAMVNSAFGAEADGMSDLEIAKEYGFVGEDETVDLAAELDNEFASKTIMRASRLVDTNASNEDVINAAVSNGIINSDSDLTDPQDAVDALTNARSAWINKEVIPHEEINYNENVTDMTQSDYNFEIKDIDNGKGVIMSSEAAKNIKQGSVFIIPSEENNFGEAFRADQIINNPDGTVTVLGSNPEINELYSKVDVGGSFVPDLNGAELLTEGVQMNVLDDEQAAPVSYDLSDQPQIVPLGCEEQPDIKQIKKDKGGVPGSFELILPVAQFSKFKLDKRFKDSEIVVKISDLNLSSDVDYETHIAGKDEFTSYQKLDYKQTVSFRLKDKAESSLDITDFVNSTLTESTIVLVSLPFQIGAGFSVNLTASIVVSLTGFVSIEYTTYNTIGYRIDDGHFQPFAERSKPDIDFKITGRIGIYLEIKLALHFILIEKDLLGIKFRVGPVIETNLTIHSSGAVCYDTSYYVHMMLYLEVPVIIEKLLVKPKFRWTIWGNNSDNPIRGNLHNEFYDGEIRTVPKCTRKDPKPETEVTTKSQYITEGKLEFEHSYYTIEEGQTLTIGIKSMPKDVELSDLEWTSSNDQIQVDENGNVTAKGAGSAVIIAIVKGTNDPNKRFSCSVSVNKAANASPQADAVGRIICEDSDVLYAA